MSPKQIFSDKEYLDNRFDRLEEAHKALADAILSHDKRISFVEAFVKYAGGGLVAICMAALSWVVGLLPKSITFHQ